MKYKIRKRKKTFKTTYLLVILIVILICISSSYAIWTARLYINGTVIGEKTEPSLPVEIPEQGQDENGVTRYSVNTSMQWGGVTIYEVISETYENNTITTTIQHKYKQWLSGTSPQPTITLTIPNNSGSDFTDGKIELIDSQDTNSIVQNLSYNLSKTTLINGDTTDATITCTLKGNKDVADNTHYNFAISYTVEETRFYFYYNLIILPR
ncbi:MAG: hypothetical protein ACI4UU_05435 [Clostridia bacterium]